MALSVIILAAGQGTRMCSQMPKVLHSLAGKPLLQHVLDSISSLDATVYIVHGHAGAQVQAAISDPALHWVAQTEQLGTGHAVLQALPMIADDDQALILYGDVPLIPTNTLQTLLAQQTANTLALLSVDLGNPTGYGRIIRDKNKAIQAIIEEKEADSQTRQIQEVNTGILAAKAGDLRQYLQSLKNDNSQGEYYLTDVIAEAVTHKVPIVSLKAQQPEHVAGINDRVQLANLERYYQQNQAENLMRQGVTIIDPKRLDIRGNISIGQDCEIDINVILEGDIQIGQGVKIGANSIIRHSQIADNVVIHPNSLIEKAQISKHCEIGPFARIRPDTVLAAQVKVGNFVEIKKSTIAKGSKISHLSYIGDTTMGADVNIGAGTITCNYDGAFKHQTIIGDNVFVGSDSQLIAPVTVGNGATIGAGTTVTRDVSADKLVISRAPQRSISDWQRPSKPKA